MIKILFRSAVLVLCAVALGIGYMYWSSPAPVQVIVEAARPGMVEQYVANTRAGTVKACLRSFPTPSVGGQVAKLYVKEGDHVKIGQLLLELDNDYLKAEVELASSEQDAAESSASASCLQSDVAHREAERLVQLKGRGAASEDQTDKTVTQAKASAAECAAARARVRVSNSKLGVAMAQLQRTRLFAPFDGVVAQVTGEIFQFVTPSPPGIATKPIIDLIGLDCFVVLAPIDEVDAARVKPGSPAHIMLDAFGDRRFPGQVRRIAPFVQDYEKQARTVDVEVEFTNTDDIQELLAGYSANVEIILGVEPQALRIPSDAIIDGEKIFVYDPTSGKLHQRSIRSGLSNWHYTQILSGINDEELVVTSVDRPGVRDGALAVVEGTSR